MASKSALNQFPGPLLQDTLMRFEAVSQAVGLRRSAVYARIRSGHFPAPVRLGARCVRWRASDIQAFICSQVS
jgi:prophage regulatory protein